MAFRLWSSGLSASPRFESRCTTALEGIICNAWKHGNHSIAAGPRKTDLWKWKAHRSASGSVSRSLTVLVGMRVSASNDVELIPFLDMSNVQCNHVHIHALHCMFLDDWPWVRSTHMPHACKQCGCPFRLSLAGEALRYDSRGVSCCPPAMYADRFNQFLKNAISWGSWRNPPLHSSSPPWRNHRFHNPGPCSSLFDVWTNIPRLELVEKHWERLQRDTRVNGRVWKNNLGSMKLKKFRRKSATLGT